MHISHHTLRIHDRDRALDFYCNKLGMRLLRSITEKHARDDVVHDFLDFDLPDSYSSTQLELISSTAFPPINKSEQTGYWKIGITLADVDIAADRLRARGVSVSDPQQFRDIGYLCHLDDPSGNTIELLQHYFEANKPGISPQPDFKLGTQAQIGQITLRIKDPGKSIAFYRDVLGMKLLSRQHVEPYRFTLYFLACTDECPPRENIDAVENREWLWQRPYTTLELQHVWGTEDSDFFYDVSPECGFEQLTFNTDNLHVLLSRLSPDCNNTVNRYRCQLFDCDAGSVSDPDGYLIKLLDANISSK